MVTLSASVGLGGINRRADVIAVQRLLQQANVSPGPIDGLCGRRTIAAIERFQHGLIAHPDGRVDVNGPTLRRLRVAAQPAPARRPATAPARPAPSSAPARPAPAVRPAPAAQPAVQPAVQATRRPGHRIRIPTPSGPAAPRCRAPTSIAA